MSINNYCEIVLCLLNDFQVIKYNNAEFLTSDFNRLHEESVDFLKRESEHIHIGEAIVVTHHVPTLLNYPQQYKGTILNEAFAVELFDLIEQSNFNYWIYGHHHSNTPDFKIGNTKMLTNQLGYLKSNEEKQFDGGKVINILSE